MKKKLLTVAALFAIANGSAFAQDLLLANAGVTEAFKSPEAATTGVAMRTVSPSNNLPAAAETPKSREQVRAELAEYNRRNPRGYLYSYYLGDLLGQR